MAKVRKKNGSRIWRGRTITTVEYLGPLNLMSGATSLSWDAGPERLPRSSLPLQDA